MGVGINNHRLPVVLEGGTVCRDDAAGGGETDGISPQTRADAAPSVLDGGPVPKLHSSLILGQLPFGAVAHDFYPLPHLVGAGRGKLSPVNDEFAAGSDDEAGARSAI